MSSVLVFGRTGQVATELQRLADVVALGRDEADLSDPAACAKAIHTHRPSAVINAAAYTAVDAAERDDALAAVINAQAPAAMAQACVVLQIPFVHISTDYVFDGTGSKAWSPDDRPDPQNAYGRSKLLGEEGIRSAGGCHAILRTSWVFSAHGGNFVKTMLRLSEGRHSVNVVADQIGGPTPSRAIAVACINIAEQLKTDRSKSGTYHFSGVPDVSWCDFAAAIFATAARGTISQPIATADYPTAARRPLNSRLDCRQTKQAFGLARADWRAGLCNVIDELEQRK